MAASMKRSTFEKDGSYNLFRCSEKKLKTANKECVKMTPVWMPVLDDVYFSDIETVDVYVADILKKSNASEIIRYLSSVYALPTLQHLKRIKAPSKPDGDLEVIIVPVSQVSNVTCSEQNVVCTRDLFKNVFIDDDMVNKFGVTARLVPVSSKSPLTRRQYNQAKTLWPTLFHEDKRISAALDGTLFSFSEFDEINGHMRTAIDEAHRSIINKQRAIGCVIVDPSSKKVMAICHDQSRSDGHPLKHAVMVAIDLVAINQGGGAWNKKDPSTSGQTSNNGLIPYLCTGYDLYVTREPCIMCCMGLVHSRIGRVFYGCVNFKNGALGSIYKLNTIKSLNHRFEVFKNQFSLSNECLQFDKYL